MNKNLLATKGLSLDGLGNFLEFADAKSIVAAAGGNAVRQSLISRQIKKLSEFFGVDLVKRQGRGLALTEPGRRLATMAREQFSALSDFAREAKELPATLGIVAPNSIATWLLMPKLAEIRRALPHHRLALHHTDTRGIISGVLEGTHDIGFVRETALARTLGRKPLGSAGFAVFVPKPLVARLKDKETDSWLRLPLALPIGGKLRESVDALATRRGVVLAPALVCDSYVQAAAAVETGAVASVLPLIAANAMSARGVRIIDVPELNSRSVRMLMIWSKRAAETRASVRTAVEVLPKLLAVE